MRVHVSFPARPASVAYGHAAKPCDSHNPGRRKRQYHWGPSQYVFLVLAIVCIGLYGYAYLDRVLYQTYESWSFDRATHRMASAAGSNQEITPV